MKTRCTGALFALMSFAVLGLTGCDQAGNGGGKIATVDLVKILNESSVGKQETERNQQVRDILVQAGQQADKEVAALPADKQKQSRLADQAILNRQWNNEQQSARAASVQAIVKAIDSYRQEKKLTLVVESHQLIASDPASDVSQAIIDSLKDTKVNFGDLPEITTKAPDDSKADEPKKDDTAAKTKKE